MNQCIKLKKIKRNERIEVKMYEIFADLHVHIGRSESNMVLVEMKSGELMFLF